MSIKNNFHGGLEADPPTTIKSFGLFRRFVRVLMVAFTAIVPLSCEIPDYAYFTRLSVDHGGLWVSLSGISKVMYINRHTDTIVGSWDVGADPSRTAVDLAGDCWVGSRGDDSVWYIKKSGKTQKFTGFGAARGIALDKDGNVWVGSSGTSTIKKISKNKDGTYAVSSGQVNVTGASKLYGALVDGSNNLWISDNGSTYALHKYDLSKWPSQSGLTTYPFACAGYGFTIDRKGKIWIGGHPASVIMKFDMASGTLEKTIPTPIAASGITMDAKGNIWGGCYSGNQVVCLNPVTETITTVTISGSQPHGIGADDAGYVYTINMGSSTVSKIDIDTKKEVFTYTVGGSPYMYSDFTGFLYRTITLGQR